MKPVTLTQISQKHRQKIQATGFPNRNLEDWKFTSFKKLQPLFEEAFGKTTSSEGKEASVAKFNEHLLYQQIGDLLLPMGSVPLVVTPIGVLTQEKDDSYCRENGIEILGLDTALSLDGFQKMNCKWNSYQKQVSTSSDSRSLILAAVNSGVVVRVKAGCKVERPIVLIFTNTVDTLTASRSLVWLDREAEIDLLVVNGKQEGPTNTKKATKAISRNAVLDIVQMAGSKLTLLESRFNQVGLTHMTAFLNRDSELRTFSVKKYPEWQRHEQLIYLREKGAKVSLNSSVDLRAENFADSFVQIQHLVGHTESSQNFKSKLADQSHYVFKGKVVIAKNSSKASSVQVNKNLLLSEKAQVDALPQLEIYNDDVKATHGATVGQLNTEEVFYLQSRGLTKEVAEKLLSDGFLKETLINIENRNLLDWMMNEI